MSDTATETTTQVETEFQPETKSIPMNAITVSKIALRSVKRDSVEFQKLAESVKDHGVYNSILVRPIAGGRYGLIDGLQRYNAAMDAGLQEIPAVIVDMDDANMMKAQVITNMNRVLTKPAELSKHLVRILAHDPDMSAADLAREVN